MRSLCLHRHTALGHVACVYSPIIFTGITPIMKKTCCSPLFIPFLLLDERYYCIFAHFTSPHNPPFDHQFIPSVSFCPLLPQVFAVAAVISGWSRSWLKARGCVTLDKEHLTELMALAQTHTCEQLGSESLSLGVATAGTSAPLNCIGSQYRSTTAAAPAADARPISCQLWDNTANKSKKQRGKTALLSSSHVGLADFPWQIGCLVNSPGDLLSGGLPKWLTRENNTDDRLVQKNNKE